MVGKCPKCSTPCDTICPSCKNKSERATVELKKLNAVLHNIKHLLNTSALLSSSEALKVTLRRSYSQCQEEIKKYKKNIITEEQVTTAQKWWNQIVENVKKAASE